MEGGQAKMRMENSIPRTGPPSTVVDEKGMRLGEVVWTYGRREWRLLGVTSFSIKSCCRCGLLSDAASMYAVVDGEYEAALEGSTLGDLEI